MAEFDKQSLCHYSLKNVLMPKRRYGESNENNVWKTEISVKRK